MDINTISDYIRCPWKLQCVLGSVNITSFEELKVQVTKSLLNYCINLQGKQQLSVGRVKSKLNYIWAKMKEKITFQIKPDHFLILSSRVELLCNLVKNWTVVGVNYEVEHSYKKYTLSGKINALLMCTRSTAEGIIYDESLFPNGSKLDTNLRIKSLFYKTAIKQSLKPYVKHVQTRVVRLVDGHHFMMPDEDSRKLLSLTEPLYKAVQEKIYYPRASRSVCTGCNFRGVCQWSTFNTNA